MRIWGWAVGGLGLFLLMILFRYYYWSLYWQERHQRPFVNVVELNSKQLREGMWKWRYCSFLPFHWWTQGRRMQDCRCGIEDSVDWMRGGDVGHLPIVRMLRQNIPCLPLYLVTDHTQLDELA